MNTQTLKAAVRNGPYAWPGGYPLIYIMYDGEVLCHKCIKDNYKLVAKATHDKDKSGWGFQCADINWEDNNCYCAHCGNKIDSAYEE